MIRISFIFVFLILYTSSFTSRAATIPDPGKYSAITTKNIIPEKPKIASKHAKLFKIKIKEGAKKGSNFAGHYTVVSWGCGMNSYMFVVVDAITGKIYELPERYITLASHRHGDVLLTGFTNGNPSFSPNSKLLLTLGVEDGPRDYPYGRASKIYLFDDNKFRLIYKSKAPIPQQPDFSHKHRGQNTGIRSCIHIFPLPFL